MKGIAFVLLCLLFLAAFATPAFAGSESWINGYTSGGVGVWGRGEGYVDSYVSGEASTRSYSGGTYVEIGSGIYGDVYAYRGAAVAEGGAGSYASAYESSGYTDVYAGASAGSSVASMGNGGGLMYTGASTYAGAWSWQD